MNENVLNFTDIIKKSVLESSFGNISILGIIVGLIMSYAIGIIIFFVYRKSFRGVVYSYSFNFSLVLMTMITAMVIMTISSNIILSLGMVGALSIVRFRTAIKDPMDIIFMFWAITAGISTGAGLYPVAFIGTVGIALVVLSMGNFKGKYHSYILIVNYDDGGFDQIKLVLSRFKYNIKSKSVKNGLVEMTVELKMMSENTQFVEEISNIAQVRDAVLVQYNGEYAQ